MSTHVSSANGAAENAAVTLSPEADKVPRQIYDAFISYSHVKDRTIASSLQSVVQRLGKRWYRRRALRLFRDDTTLTASPHLWPDIEAALERSRFLILLASPEAAASTWVDKEVTTWLQRSRPATVLIALTAGELVWDERRRDFDWSETPPLPPALKGKFHDEPRWIDLRDYRSRASARDARFSELAANFAAVLHDKAKEDLLSQEVREQRRALRLAVGAVGLLLMLLATAGWEWRVAMARTGDAQVQHNNTLAELAAAERLQGNFEGSLRLAVLAARLNLSLGWFAHPSSLPGAELAAAMLRTRWRLVLSGHEDAVRYASYSSDGLRVITASTDRTARVWDVTTGSELSTLRRDDGLTAANFNPDGSEVVLAAGNDAFIWLTSSVAPKMTLHGHADTVTNAVFSPDGQRVLTASADGTARVWNAVTADMVTVLKGHEAAVNWAAYSSDGKRIVTASSDGTARIWDAATGMPLTILRGSGIPIFTAAFSPNGTLVVTTGGENASHVWNAETAAEIAILRGHEDQVTFGAFSPDGSLVVTSSADGTARLWDWTQLKTIAVLRGHEGGLSSAHFNRDGTKIVTASWDGTARVWNTTSGSAIFAPAQRLGAMKLVAFSPAGSHILMLSLSGKTELWPIAALDAGETLQADGRSASFSADGSRIIVTSVTGMVRIWDAASGRLDTESPEGVFVENASLSPDNSRVVTISGSDVTIWDVQMRQRIATIHTPSSLLGALVSPDNAKLVTVSLNAVPQIWDVATGKEIVKLQGHKPPFRTNSAAFSLDGRLLVTSSLDKTARIWDARSGEEIAIINGHSAEVRSAVFSADGARVVTTSADGMIRIWDSATIKEIIELDLRSPVRFAALSPDGSQLIAAADDHLAEIWDIRYAMIPTTKLLAEACSNQLLGRATLTAAEMRSAGYAVNASPRNVCLP